MTGRATAPSPPRFVPFGQYLLLDRLAVGGMAEVYLAKRFDENGPSDLLAVKRILPSLAESSDFIRMFLDEARIAAQLVHPGIVRIRELGRIGRSHYLAMDFVWGKDLLQVMRRHKLLGAQLSPSVVAYIGIGMCDALHYAHEKRDRHGQPMNLIHRDVSPQNVLVSFDGIVSLIDFGIAKAQSRTKDTQAGVLKGKIGYMSPEQIRGTRHVDRRSDLFAVGTCLYELLTLRTLFARENAFDAMENVKHVKAAPIGELRPDLTEDFAAILTRAHAEDPAERWQTAADFGDALRKYLREHDPRFDRVAAVTWMRDAFRKELHSERFRLEAFDQLGRAQVVSVDAPRRNSVTDLQIPGTGDPAPPDWDDDNAETIISADPIPFVDEPPPPANGAAEVYFSAEHTIPDDEDEPPPAITRAARIESDDDVALAASQIDSAVIQRLLPEEGEERATSAREPTARHSTADRDVEPPSGSSSNKWFGRVVLALLLLGAGAGAAWLYGSMASRASIEVRTTPQVEASVLLDGVQRGTAPVRLENVAAGSHEVTIVATGYEVVHREIEVDASTTVMVEVALVPIRGSP